MDDFDSDGVSGVFCIAGSATLRSDAAPSPTIGLRKCGLRAYIRFLTYGGCMFLGQKASHDGSALPGKVKSADRERQPPESGTTQCNPEEPSSKPPTPPQGRRRPRPV